MNEETIFAKAFDLADPVERANYIRQACGGDTRLERRIIELLKSAEDAGSFMASPVNVGGLTVDSNPEAVAFAGPQTVSPVAEQPGSVIGRYKLLQQIGEGGFGVVYMAEQETPVKRRVALKVIKAGMDTRAVIARFEAERQALAMMDHPNIARVLDAGATDTGRPYFVMELVKGVPITEYCDQANLSTRQRLELFVDVCRAVQHAHQKGIIHRDLKPSNIMITLRDDRPNVKVIDFGIAKATEQKLTEKTLFTTYGQMIGTPVYMSPEQAVMSEFDVDTRSDVYSLGILLYELLAGTPPFDAQTLRKAGFDEMRRIIREESPQKPSTRLNTLALATRHAVASQRQASPQALIRQLNGDLDWIVLKAIEKDRTRRYESASAFAQDIERHLNSEAVTAGAPGRIYKLKRFAKRHKGSLAVVAIVAVSLVIGTSVSTWQAVRATHAGRAELQQRLIAESAEAHAVVQQERAESQELRADAERLYAQGQLARAERLLYTSKLLLAQNDFEAGSGGTTSRYLDETQPALRGWEYRYLRNRVDSKLTLTGHTAELSNAQFSPDGARIITSSHDGTARVWNATTGTQLFGLPADRGLVMDAAFSPDGKQIVTGGGDWGKGKKPGEVKIWNAATGALIADLKGHEYCVWSVAFSSDGKRIVSGAGDFAYGPGEIKLWDAQSGKEMLTIGKVPMGVHALALSPDGNRIAAGGQDGTRVFDAMTGKLVFRPSDEGLGIRRIAYSPDGKHFATANDTLTVNVFDSDTGKKALTLVGHASFITGVAFSPDAKTIATSSGDKTARVWDAASGLVLLVLKSHTDTVRGVSFSPDGKRLVTASNDKTARLWDAQNGQRVPKLAGHMNGANGIAFTADSRRVATAGGDGTAKIWDAGTNQLILTLGQSSSDFPKAALWSVAFSPDGMRVVTGGKNIEVWDTITGRRLLQLPQNKTISSVAYSPDGTRILTSASKWGQSNDSPSEVKIFDAVTGKQLSALKHPAGVCCAAYNRDGSQIVTGGWDMRARVWDANSGEIFATMTGHTSCITKVAFSPDGKHILTASFDKTVRVWDTSTGNPILTLAGHTAVVRNAAYSPDGSRIVTGSDDRSVKLWDARSGLEVFVMHDMPEAVYSLAVSPDGQRISAGFTGIDGTVNMWFAPSIVK